MPVLLPVKLGKVGSSSDPHIQLNLETVLEPMQSILTKTVNAAPEEAVNFITIKK